jgi:hypothetical protein
MEFRTRLEAGLSVELPSSLAFDYPTLDTLVDFLIRGPLQMDDNASGRPGSRVAPRGLATTGAMLERLSDNEVESLLIEKLRDL